jgi:hypothetical protein
MFAVIFLGLPRSRCALLQLHFEVAFVRLVLMSAMH